MKKFQILAVIGVILASVALLFSVMAIPMFCKGCSENEVKSWYEVKYVSFLLKGAEGQDELRNYQKLYLATFFLHVISIAFTIVVIAMAGVVIFSKSGQSKGFVITLVVFGALAASMLLIAAILHGLIRKDRKDLYDDVLGSRSAVVSEQDDLERPRGPKTSFPGHPNLGSSSKATRQSEDDKATQAFDIRLAMLIIATGLFTGALVCLIIASCDAIQKVHIKLVTIDGQSISASDLAELHDGERYESPALFSAGPLTFHQLSPFTPNIEFQLLSQGYTLRTKIATALVFSIRLYYGKQRDDFGFFMDLFGGFVVADVCDSQSSNCFSCGSQDFRNPNPGQFSDYNTSYLLQLNFKCNNSRDTVNEVLLKLPNQIIIPNEVVVFGTEIVKEEIRKVEIHRGGEFLSQWTRIASSINKSIDRNYGKTESACFISTAGMGESWVSLELPWSIVSHINLLTLKTSIEAEGLWIDVCSHGIQCLLCGVMTSTKPGDWAGIYCLGGFIAGNEVQIRHNGEEESNYQSSAYQFILRGTSRRDRESFPPTRNLITSKSSNLQIVFTQTNDSYSKLNFQ